LRFLGLRFRAVNGDSSKDEHFKYEPGQARKRRFYKEGLVAIAKYLDETEGGGHQAPVKEFLADYHERRDQAGAQHRIVQGIVQVKKQNHSALVIRDGMLFLPERSVAWILGTNAKGIANTIRRIEEKSASLVGAEGLEVGVHFDYFDKASGRHWSWRGIALLARTMYEEGHISISKPRKASVKAVYDVVKDCFEVERKQLQSHEARRVRSAKERARRMAKACAVTEQKPNAAADNPIELEAHHLFDAATRPDLAALDENLLVITSAEHRNFHHLMGNRPCEPRDFLDYVVQNKLEYFKDTPSTRDRQKRRLQKLIHRLEMLQARYEDNQLPY